MKRPALGCFQPTAAARGRVVSVGAQTFVDVDGVRLARVPTRWTHLADKKSCRFNMLEQILTAEPVSTSAGFALGSSRANQPARRLKGAGSLGACLLRSRCGLVQAANPRG